MQLGGPAFAKWRGLEGLHWPQHTVECGASRLPLWSQVTHAEHADILQFSFEKQLESRKAN